MSQRGKRFPTAFPSLATKGEQGIRGLLLSLTHTHSFHHCLGPTRQPYHPQRRRGKLSPQEATQKAPELGASPLPPGAHSSGVTGEQGLWGHQGGHPHRPQPDQRSSVFPATPPQTPAPGLPPAAQAPRVGNRGPAAPQCTTTAKQSHPSCLPKRKGPMVRPTCWEASQSL